MGLICPCGTGADQEERETHKTTSTGVSTQLPKENCRQHRQKKQSSPSKKPLVVSGESTDSFRKLEHQRQAEGISHNPKDIKPCIPKNQTGSPRNEHHQRSRSSSSHHQRTGKDAQKHQRRSHSSEDRSAEKRTVLRNRREHHHRQYGGTDDTKGVSNVKTKRDLPHPEVKKDHGKHRDTEVSISKSKGRSRHRETEVTVVKSEMKMTRNSHSPKSEKEKKAKERLLPSTDQAKYVKVEEKKTQKYVKVEDKKAQRKPRSSTPAYVIPMSAMLK